MLGVLEVNVDKDDERYCDDNGPQKIEVSDLDAGHDARIVELAENGSRRLRIKEEIPVLFRLSEIRYQIQHYVVEHQRDESLVGVEPDFEERDRKAQKSAREHRGDAHQKDRQRSGKPCYIECHDSGADGTYKELTFASDIPEPHLE